MSENYDAGSEPGTSLADVLKHALEGGLLRLVVGKPVQQAIGRLIYGAADVPAAYLESWAQRKRNETSNEKQIAAAITLKAKKVAAADDDLVQRAVDRATRKSKVRQESIEDVAVRAIGILNEQALPLGAAAPTEDFMRTFEDMAEQATTESVADLLARVLAGEIRKPLSVTRRTLQTVAVMDQELVKAVEYIRSRLLEPSWAFYPEGDGEFTRHAELVESVSIARTVTMSAMHAHSQGEIRVTRGDKTLILVSVPKNQFFIQALALTPTGREICGLFPASTQDNLREVAFSFMLMPQIGRIDICDREVKDGRLYESNRRVYLPEP